MRIQVTCEHCWHEFSVPAERAGQRGKCPECRGPVRVPDNEGYSIRQSPPRRSSSGRANRRQPATSGFFQPHIVIPAGIGAFLVILMIVVFLVLPSDNGPAGGSGLTGNTLTADDLTEEEKAERQRQYQETLNQQQAIKSSAARDSMVDDFGANKVVTVIFDDVIGETEAANKYLQRKLFRAVYHDYAQSSKAAKAQTEQNRKAAEQKAIADHKKTWGGFGPTFVTYRYQVVESDVPYPRVVNAGRVENSFTFHVAPASDVQALVSRIGVGTVSSTSGRTVRIRSQLPVPIPDPDVEELALSFGLERVLNLEISGAEGDPDSVQFFLELELRKSGDSTRPSSMAGLKALGEGNYKLSVAPVDNPRVLIDRLDWAELVEFDETRNRAVVRATLPEKLPTQAEIDALREQERKEGEEIRKADRDNRPRPGESELDWALRAADSASHYTSEKPLKVLATMEIDEARREEVSRFLLARLDSQDWNFEHILRAAVHWKTEQTEEKILQLGGEFSIKSHRNRDVVMETLVALGSEKSATALASGLADFFVGDKSVGYLIQMGPVAEKPVQEYLQHKDAKVRSRAYSVLAKIGTEDSLDPLSSNYRQERDSKMKDQAKFARDAIRTRIKEAEQKESESKEPEM